MRVVLVHPFTTPLHDDLSVPESLAREHYIAKHLVACGWQTEVISLHNGSASFELTVDDVGWAFLPSGLMHLADLILKRVDSGDILIIKGLGTELGRVLAGRHGGRLVVICGGLISTVEALQADYILVEDVAQALWFATLYPQESIQYLPKYVPSNFAERDDRIQKYDIIVVSEFRGYKNMSILRKFEDLDFRILVVGDGPLKQGIEASISKRARCQFNFAGSVSRDEVAELMKSSKVLLHPSKSEGFPRVVAEALVSGIPVVARSEVVGWPLLHEISGLVAKDDQDLVACCVRLLDDPDLLEKLGSNAREIGRVQFSGSLLKSAVYEFELWCRRPQMRRSFNLKRSLLSLKYSILQFLLQIYRSFSRRQGRTRF
jgi:hypothetical protein